MKETYINITEECDAIDKLCVICLEIEDEMNNITIIRSELLKSKCDCCYYIHKSCFKKWINKRPVENLNCLICSSKATQVLTCKEKCIKIGNSKRLLICIKEFCKFTKWFLCVSVIWFILTEIDNIKNNYDE